MQRDETDTDVAVPDATPRIFALGEPMPLVFGGLADDDMCNMFGYFISQADLTKLPLPGRTAGVGYERRALLRWPGQQLELVHGHGARAVPPVRPSTQRRS